MNINKRLTLLFCLVFSQLEISATENNCLQMHVIQSIPLGYYDDSGNLIGVHVEMLEAIEQHSGLCFDKLLMPVPRIVKSLAQGQHDGGIILRSSKRDHMVELVAYITDIETVVIPRQGVKINDYSDLHEIVVGKIGGMPLSNNFDSDRELVLVQVNRYGQAAQMLERGRVQALAGGGGPLYHNLSKIDGIENIVDVSSIFVLGSKDQWLQLSKKSVHLDKSAQLKRGVGMMKHSGDYDRIKLKYYGSIYRSRLAEAVSN